jgi:hypothetical protein
MSAFKIIRVHSALYHAPDGSDSTDDKCRYLKLGADRSKFLLFLQSDPRSSCNPDSYRDTKTAFSKPTKTNSWNRHKLEVIFTAF